MFVCPCVAKNPQDTQERTHAYMLQNELLTIYGARLSKSGQHINIILVKGEGEAKQFFTACVKIDEEAKTHGEIDEGHAIITIPLLNDAKPSKSKDELDDLLPF